MSVRHTTDRPGAGRVADGRRGQALAGPPLELSDVGPDPYLFLSPHLDDVALSCSALVAELSRRGRVVVATFFTEAGPPPFTLSAHAFARRSGAPDPRTLYAARRAEDRAALSTLDVEPVHLGLVDALFRRRTSHWTGPRRPAELQAVYPTYRWHVARGTVSRRDTETVQTVEDHLRALVAEVAPGTVVAPMGTGRHVDHLVVAQATERAVPDAVYYADLPYALTAGADHGLVRRRQLRPRTWQRGVEHKPALLALYGTQLHAMFPGGPLPDLTECYYLPAGRLHDG